MTAIEIIDAVQASGGVLALKEDRIRYQIPERSASLLDELRRHKLEVLDLLRLREQRRAVAHLLPFLGKRIWTPLGPGRLVTVENYVTVELETGGKVRWYDSTMILPYA